ncbi:MAG TPA: hypothetical protein VK698_03430 [Kofleriaceae bacterium]|nr:hypothetical protein [Kofleriaceae bacterium]
MRRILIPLLVSGLLFAVSGCALEEAEGQELDEVSAAEPDTELDTQLDTAPASADDEAPQQLEGEEPPGGPHTNTTYYDGCIVSHQACHCQNTGWAGYCKWTVEWPDEWILRCYCG